MDKYSKAVLTVIAVCLVLLTTKEVFVEPVYALDKYHIRAQIIECLDDAKITGYFSSSNGLSANLETKCQYIAPHN